MMNANRFTIFLLGLGFFLSGNPVASVAEDIDITILHTNDLHQHLKPLPLIAGYVSQYKKNHRNTVFVDAGDWFDRGSSLVPLTQGEALYGAMEAMGYDMWILGNHDWAYGGERLIELMRHYPVPVLATNLATTRPPLPPNVIQTMVKEFGGIRVGFFGITLDTYGKDPMGRPNLYVLDCNKETARAVAKLKEEKVDLIVVVTHLGFKKMSHEVGRSSHPSDQDLIAAHPDIDIVIGGHSHTLLKEKVIRDIYAKTGSIITQAGASGNYVGRLTVTVDNDERKIKSFEVEAVPVTDKLPVNQKVAGFLQRQYAEHMPRAKENVGEFKLAMQFHDLAFWYADFIRQRAGTEISLMPRKTLYDERKSLPAGKLDVERMSGYLYNRYIIKATIKGSDLLKYCNTNERRDLFNPFHHQERPFSGDALFYTGFEVTFQADSETVKFDINPEKTYTVAIPWPFTNRDIRKYRNQLPPRQDAEKADPVPGLVLIDFQVMDKSTSELLIEKGVSSGLDFYQSPARPESDWAAWTKHFEAKL